MYSHFVVAGEIGKADTLKFRRLARPPRQPPFLAFRLPATSISDSLVFNRMSVYGKFDPTIQRILSYFTL